MRQQLSERRHCEHALSEHVELVEREPWLNIIEQRFGIPADTFEEYALVRPNTHSLHLVAADHLPPERPAPQVIGMSFMRTRMKHPKLTTAAAMSFGHLAGRNTVAADRRQADAFLHRQPFEAQPEQLEECTGPGYVLVRIEDAVLGVGLLRPDAAKKPEVSSYVPKAWTLPEGESAFCP